MAVYWSSKQNGSQLRLTTAVLSQSAPNNTSSFAMDLDVIVDSGWFIEHSGTSAGVIIDGSGRGSFSGQYRRYNPGTTRIFSPTATITHNSDGTRSVAVYGGLVMPGIFDQGVSGTDVLATIPRATTPNIGVETSFVTGAARTINLPRASGSFTHDVTWKVGAKSGTVATGAGATASLTLGHDVFTEYPNAASGQVEITVVTKNGGTVIGTRTVTFALTAGAAVVPTVSTVTWDDGNSTVKANIGGFVQGRSLIKGTASAAGVHGSTVVEKRLKIGSATLTENQQVVIADSGTVTASGEATDSRGRVGSKAANFTVLAWDAPQINTDTFKVERTDAAGVPQQDGQYMKLTLASTVSSLIVGTEKNSQTITVRTRPIGGSYTNRNSIAAGLSYSASPLITGGAVFLNAVSYEVEVTVTDKTGYQAVITRTVQTAVPTLDLNGTFLGVAKMHERGALDVGGDVYADAFYAGPGPTFIKASLEGHTHTGAEVAAATETTRGTVEQATQAEADAGSDDTRYMTPKKVRERASRAGAFTVVRGVLNTNRVQSVTRDGDMVTVTLAVDNGNGLTLNSGYQVMVTIPEWARPAKDVVLPGTRADAIGGALVRIAPNGEISAASSGGSVTFTATYPAAT